jgi:hypothetical protein
MAFLGELSASQPPVSVVMSTRNEGFWSMAACHPLARRRISMFEAGNYLGLVDG